MAKLIVITHEFDFFAYRLGGRQAPVSSPYLLFDVLKHLQAFGHSFEVSRGPQPRPGDVALLHVDEVNLEHLALSSLDHGVGRFDAGRR